jgi:ribonuclease E
MNDYRPDFKPRAPQSKKILVDARDEQQPVPGEETRKRPERVRIAVTEGGILCDLDTEYIGYTPKKANIYKGIITRIEPSLEAAFVKYDEGERHGFLPFKEISPEYFLTTQLSDQEQPHLHIKNALREGQEVMVRVEKEERGTKGAALSTFISLAGSYLILMPNNPRAGGVSRRIEVSEERDQMRELMSQLQLPENMGVIARTAGVGKTLEELQWDLSILLHHWEAIKKAFHERPGPFLIHQESDIVTRMIRDYLHKDISEIIVEGEAAFQKAKQYIDQIRPDFSQRLRLYKDTIPLFSRFQIEQQIETAYQREVQLPSGGSIVIDHTEALVTIDVNSAKATKGGDIEETAFSTNLEATSEVARQLRLRDIGGLIVIDFIDMTQTRHQREVENRLREASKLDRARVQIGRISRFGLLEMSRQRLRPSLVEASRIVCPRCGGQGAIRSVESLAMTILRILEEEAMHSNTEQVQAQLPVDIATFLLNEKREALSNIEKRQKVNLLIIPNIQLQSPQYRIRRLREEEVGVLGIKTPASYKLFESVETELSTKKISIEKTISEPAVKPTLPSAPTPTLAKKGAPNLIKRFLNVMFGSTETPPESGPTPAPSPTKTEPSAASRGEPAKPPKQGEGRGFSGRQGAGRGGRGRRGGYRGPGPRQRGGKPYHQSGNKPSTENPATRPTNTAKSAEPSDPSTQKPQTARLTGPEQQPSRPYPAAPVPDKPSTPVAPKEGSSDSNPGAVNNPKAPVPKTESTSSSPDFTRQDVDKPKEEK